MVLRPSSQMLRPPSPILSTVTAAETPLIESLNVDVAEPCAIEAHITVAESLMIELQPTGAGGTTFGVESGGAVSADVNTGAAALGADLGGAVSAGAGSGAAASGADSVGAISADIDSGSVAWCTPYVNATCEICAHAAVLRSCRCVWIYRWRYAKN